MLYIFMWENSKVIFYCVLIIYVNRKVDFFLVYDYVVGYNID